MATERPLCASATARLTVTEDLPTPPLPDETPIDAVDEPDCKNDGSGDGVPVAVVPVTGARRLALHAAPQGAAQRETLARRTSPAVTTSASVAAKRPRCAPPARPGPASPPPAAPARRPPAGASRSALTQHAGLGERQPEHGVDDATEYLLERSILGPPSACLSGRRPDPSVRPPGRRRPAGLGAGSTAHGRSRTPRYTTDRAFGLEPGVRDCASGRRRRRAHSGRRPVRLARRRGHRRVRRPDPARDLPPRALAPRLERDRGGGGPSPCTPTWRATTSTGWWPAAI